MSHDASQLKARLHSVPRHGDEPNRIVPVGRYSHERLSRQFGETPLRWWFRLTLCAVILICVGAACQETDTNINGDNDVMYLEPRTVDYLPTPCHEPKDKLR